MRNWWLYPSLAITLLGSDSDARSPIHHTDSQAKDQHAAVFGPGILSAMQIGPLHAGQRWLPILVYRDGGPRPVRLRAWIGSPQAAGDSKICHFLLEHDTAAMVTLTPPTVLPLVPRLWLEADYDGHATARCCYDLHLDTDSEGVA